MLSTAVNTCPLKNMHEIIALFLEPHMRTDQKVCFGLQSYTYE